MLADRIAVVRNARGFSITVDGIEIPGNAILGDSVTIPVDPDGVPEVHLTLIARQVEFRNALQEGT
ncbi:hypothetical protein J4H86_21140 [Spiractinospora alimapuensis]|uniref:hypothetical protein n=1 Tax=Spiractinospora alimapuensis TaxID=2820884 RepID=UPI001F246F91|nr:hypothetical protein [Spiractinospora alimapuensis]QVQ51300.1 hypothetical protein J4H86_21140 [Spiractinospora alimapuensis]